jgi:hypothetical protein
MTDKRRQPDNEFSDSEDEGDGRRDIRNFRPLNTPSATAAPNAAGSAQPSTAAQAFASFATASAPSGDAMEEDQPAAAV